MKDLYYNLNKIQHHKLGRYVAVSKLKQFISKVQRENEDSNFVSISLKNDEIQSRVMKHRVAYNKMIQTDQIHALEGHTVSGIEEDLSFGEIQVEHKLVDKVSFLVKQENQHKLKYEFNKQMNSRRKYKIIANPHTANDAMSDYSTKSFLSTKAARSEGYSDTTTDSNFIALQTNLDTDESRDFNELRTSSRSKNNESKRIGGFLPFVNSPDLDVNTTSSSSPVLATRYSMHTDPRDALLPLRIINQSPDYNPRSKTSLSKYSSKFERETINEAEDRSSSEELIVDSFSPEFLRYSPDLPKQISHLMNIVSDIAKPQINIPELEIETSRSSTFRKRGKRSRTQMYKKTVFRPPNITINTKHDISSVYGSSSPPKKEVLPMINISRVNKQLISRVRVVN